MSKLSGAAFSKAIYFSIGVSLLGLLLIAVLTFKDQTSTVDFPFRKHLVSSIFGVICILGIIAGASPGRCSKSLLPIRSRDTKLFKAMQESVENTIKFKGHHPTCGHFSAHTLRLGDKTFCAGCSGLVLGAVTSLIGDFLIFFTGFHVREVGVIFFWLGFVWVASVFLIYSLFNLITGITRFLLNILFVLGTFFLLIGVDGISRNLILDFYLLIIIVYWIMTRIMISKWGHKKICADCDLKSCNYRLIG